MQNIPGIALETASDQLKTIKLTSFKTGESQSSFADLFSQHASLVQEELALSPVSTNDKMLETAPQTTHKEAPVNAAGNKATVKEEKTAEERNLERRMTKEDLEEVREDLKEYGMTDDEISKIEEKVNSEDGMTWGQFVSVVAQKAAELRKVELSGEQKTQLGSFFSKFGFSSKESDQLISQLEKGNFSKVMSELQKKIDAMPSDQQLLFSKDEIEAFSTAMSFSKEFTSQLKELFGKNMLGKDMKEAFTLIRQEMANMDKKDQDLVKAVGKVFASAVGDKTAETTVAKQINEAVDLKPRVAEDNLKGEAKEDFKQALETRKETVSDTQVRKSAEKSLPEKAEVDKHHSEQETESNNTWNQFNDKLREDVSTSGKAQTKSETADALKTGLAEAGTTSSTKAWEKVAAPKIMKQVETAVLKTLNNGTKQLTLELNPDNLGKLNVVLQVQGKEVTALIKADNADTAKIINENIDVIKNALENQGLKVEKLEVQAGLTGNQDDRNWFGQDQHNMARDRDAMVAMRNHMKNMRGNGGVLAQDLQSVREQAIYADQGLHVIA